MAKKVDKAGHWRIKGNPLSREGVYMYSGKVIDPNNQMGYGLSPDTLYPVYRPKAELEKACDTFNGKPIRDEHEMIGNGEGMTHADSAVQGGAIYNVRMNPEDDSEMIGDMEIYSEAIQREVSTGEKSQLSLGYFCKYRKENGKFGGKDYMFVQYDLEGNHVALVKEGRMGSGVRVFDSMTYDSLEITSMKNRKKVKTVDAEEQKGGLREEISKMLEGKDEDTLMKVKDALEGVLNPDKPKDGEDEEENEPEDKSADDCGDEDEENPADKPEEGEDEGEEEDPADSEDEEEDEESDPSDGEDEEEDDTPAKSEGKDSKAMDMKEVMREIARRDKIADGVSDIIGAFDHSEMTAEEVAVYACDKLELPKDGNCVARIEGFIACKAKSKNFIATTAVDAAEESSDFVSKYLNK